MVDLACGSGTLLVAAYHRKRELLKSVGKPISLEDHKTFLEHDLTGIDIMPFAAHLAVMHLSLQALLHETEKVRVAVWDSTELKPGMEIPAISSELKAAYRRPTLDMFQGGLNITKDVFIKKGAITLDGLGGKEISLEKVDLVIMNPPFTRQERLPKDYKKALERRLKEYKKSLNGPIGLHGYFIFLADRFVKPNGKIALVLPATTLRIAAMHGIRKLLVSEYVIEYIITTYQRAAFSEGASFREILLVGQKAKARNYTGNSTCLVVFLKKNPQSVQEANELSQMLKDRRAELKNGSVYENEYIQCKSVSQSNLKASVSNLFKFIAASDWEIAKTWEKIEKRGLLNSQTS